jgi:hypothetical protein
MTDRHSCEREDSDMTTLETVMPTRSQYNRALLDIHGVDDDWKVLRVESQCSDQYTAGESRTSLLGPLAHPTKLLRVPKRSRIGDHLLVHLYLTTLRSGWTASGSFTDDMRGVGVPFTRPVRSFPTPGSQPVIYLRINSRMVDHAIKH